MGERLDPLLDGVALIGERDLGALVGHGLGDAPGDRAVIGDAEHDAALARHQLAAFSHRPTPFGRKALYRLATARPEGFSGERCLRPIGAGLRPSSASNREEHMAENMRGPPRSILMRENVYASRVTGAA